MGLVQTQYFHHDGTLPLESGQQLGPLTLAYETYGTLNAARDNAILILHALSGDAHVAGFHTPDDRKPGWWDVMVGPGKAFDTTRYFVLCANIIGGCMGSTGPKCVNPATGEPYAMAFPIITIGDMVNAQRLLMDALDIPRWYAVTGGSMGGMQALQWATAYPERVAHCIPIATTHRLSAMSIGFNAVGRAAIMSDPHWQEGHYYGGELPTNGLAVARMVAHITYLSEQALTRKFGRRVRGAQALAPFGDMFEVESYLRHQGSSFVRRFDAASYLTITRATDYFDLAEEHGRREPDAYRHGDGSEQQAGRGAGQRDEPALEAGEIPVGDRIAAGRVEADFNAPAPEAALQVGVAQLMPENGNEHRDDPQRQHLQAHKSRHLVRS